MAARFSIPKIIPRPARTSRCCCSKETAGPDQVVDAVVITDVVEDADVLVLEACYRPRFSLETLFQLGLVGQMRAQSLEGNNAVQPRVVRFIHLAHPASAKQREHFVGAEFCSGFETHFPVGTFCFNSSNQFSTTFICVAEEACSAPLSIMNRLPSEVTS